MATDDKPHAIVKMIAERERQLATIEARLVALKAAPSAIDLETRRMEREARLRLSDMRGLFARNADAGRKALEALLDGPLSFSPIDTADGRRYQITGRIALGNLLSPGPPSPFTTVSVPSGI